MGKSPWIAGAVMIFVSMGSAHAAPGPKILTIAGKAERTSSTSGVTLEDVGGVSLIKGPVRTASAEEGATLLGADLAPASEKVAVKVEYRWRRLRHLRTQGFYSGKGYPSRRYTQGFYSGR